MLSSPNAESHPQRTHASPPISAAAPPCQRRAPLSSTPTRTWAAVQLRSELLAELRDHDVLGTILIAPECINGRVCYPCQSPFSSGCCRRRRNHDGDKEDDPVSRYLTMTHPLFGGPGLMTRASVRDVDDGHAFRRLKVRIKNEIVTLSPRWRSIAVPALARGGYVLPEMWAEVAINSLTTMVTYLRPLFFDLRKIVVSSPIFAASAIQR